MISSSILKAYWWRHRGFINLGDEINGHILQYVSGRRIERSGAWTADITAIGSVLDNPLVGDAFSNGRTKKLWVWGSGAMDNKPIPWLHKLNVAAVRGSLTASLLDSSTATSVLGDPGLLAPRVWNKKTGKKHKWGIIPHHSHLGSDWVERFLSDVPNSILIDVRNPDFDEVFASISSSEYIASSSLHGMIFADAWGIPNFRINVSRNHRGGDLKFKDYFSSVLRPIDTPIEIDEFEELKNLKIDYNYFKYFGAIDLVADRLEGSFPRELRNPTV